MTTLKRGVSGGWALVLLFFFHAPPSEAARAKLLWSDEGQGAWALDVTAYKNRVYAAGVGRQEHPFDFLVRAYKLRSGRIAWVDQVDTEGGDDRGRAVTAARGRVFAAGVAGGGYLIRAYDARSGKLLWEDRGEPTNPVRGAMDVTARGKRVYLAGDFGVIAYDAASGEILWTDGVGGLFNALAARGSRLYAVGRVGTDAVDTFDFVVRAYNSRTGELLWEDVHDVGMDEAFAVATDGVRVAVAGMAGPLVNEGFSGDFLVRTYRAPDGVLLWEDQVDGLGNFGCCEEATAVALHSNRVFAGGYFTADASGNVDGLVAAYDAETGELAWRDQNDLLGLDGVMALAVSGRRLLSCGVGGYAFQVRSLDRKDARVFWEDRYPDSESCEALTVAKDRVFAVGGPRFVVRAYRKR